MIASPECPSCGRCIGLAILLGKKMGVPFKCPKCRETVALILVGPRLFEALADMTSDWACANGRTEKS